MTQDIKRMNKIFHTVSANADLTTIMATTMQTNRYDTGGPSAEYSDPVPDVGLMTNANSAGDIVSVTSGVKSASQTITNPSPSVSRPTLNPAST